MDPVRCRYVEAEEQTREVNQWVAACDRLAARLERVERVKKNLAKCAGYRQKTAEYFKGWKDCAEHYKKELCAALEDHGAMKEVHTHGDAASGDRADNPERGQAGPGGWQEDDGLEASEPAQLQAEGAAGRDGLDHQGGRGATAPTRQRTITLDVPCPDRRLNPNQARRIHRRTLAKIEAESIQAVKVAALQWVNTHRRPRLPAALVQCTIYAKDPSWIMDGDNALALSKTLFDGLTKAGLFTDDKHLVHWPVLQPVDKTRAGRVLVIIKPRPPGWTPVLMMEGE